MSSCSSESDHTADLEPVADSQLADGIISFGTIEVREHAMILGKGPSASGSGPSLEIDWESQARTIVGLEEYEAVRHGRRKKHELIMPGTYRRDLLLESGYTMQEISQMSEKEKSVLGPARKAMKKLSKLMPRNKR